VRWNAVSATPRTATPSDDSHTLSILTPTAAAASAARHNLRRQRTSFLGREQVIAERRGVAIELNTRLFCRHAHAEASQRFVDAHLRLLKKAKAAGAKVAVSSDAHRPR
jgi:hypothetical protein